LLATLPDRDKRAGYAEAVKVALIRDRGFFESLERDADLLAAFEPGAMQRMIYRSAELHVEHIAGGGDPFESGSARPLDFGHWAAHKLEQLSDYQIRHGEAVAIGLALDVIYSRNIGLLDAASAARVLALLRKAGLRLVRQRIAAPRRRTSAQYLGTLWSISSDQALMPPLTLLTYLNPCSRRKLQRPHGTHAALAMDINLLVGVQFREVLRQRAERK
jgi:3-dehydroquinate synthetase